MAAERDEAKRQRFQEEVAAIAANDLVFLDEAGVSLSLSVLYGWGKKGQPLVEAVQAKRGPNLSVLGAMDIHGIVAATSSYGAMVRTDVEKFLKDKLLPKLLPGTTLVLDNASIHKGGKIESIVKKAGCKLLYLSPYSPDFNPIELFWAWLKRQLRQEGPRDDAARAKAVNKAFAQVPETLAVNCFRHCNYILTE